MRARRPASTSESRPANVVGTLSTRHLKNTDLATGPQAISPIYEMCTNDLAQAIDWSERQATWQGQYSDLVEVRSDARMFEVVRVPRADVSAMMRHRVFRCDYLDRSGTDLRADAGAAGSMNQRPLTAVELEKLAEYLWQFTMFNNSDYAVESSTTASSGSIADADHSHGPAGARQCRRCDTVADRRLDPHHEWRRWHAVAHADAGAFVQGEGQRIERGELRGLKPLRGLGYLRSLASLRR